MLCLIEFSMLSGAHRALPDIALGAPGGTRTPTPLQKTDFESVASTNSATEALLIPL